MKKSTLLLATLFISLLVNAQPGSLDLSFGSGGIVTTDWGGIYDHGYSIAIQSDGKFLVAGGSKDAIGFDFALARYNIDGSLDNTFDTDGKVTTDFGTNYEEAASVAIQGDGKILVAGYRSIGLIADFALARYNTDGSLDNTFDTDGKVTTAIGSLAGYRNSVAIQSDGKILVTGNSDNGSDDDFVLVRYNIDGSLDNTFDLDGIVTTNFGSNDDRGFSVAIQSDGKILVAGRSDNGATIDFALARYNNDGGLDNTFDTDGKLTTPIGPFDDFGRSMVIQDDGKILVAGTSDNGFNFDFALVRYNTNGSLDNAFDSDGKVITAIGSTEDDGHSVTTQSDGKILVAGWTDSGGNYDFALARYNIDGSLDNSFDLDGKVTTSVGVTFDGGESIALQSDGKILVAGFNENGWNDDFAIVRYNAAIIGIEEVGSPQLAVSIYPNPFTHSTILEIKNTELIMQDVELKIYDVLGRIVHQQILNSKIETLNLNLPGGTYFYKIYKEKKEIVGVGGKLIIQ